MNFKLRYSFPLIFVCAFAFHIFIFICSKYAINPDSPGYIVNAEHLLRFNFDALDITRPIFYSSLIACFIPVFKNPEIVGVALSLIFSSFLPVMVFYFGEKVFNRRTGILSSILVVVYPALSLYSFSVLTEATYTTIVFFSILITWKAVESGKLLFYLVSGILVGLSYLTRHEGIIYSVFAFFFMFITIFIDKGQDRRKRIAGLAVFSFALILTISPYIVLVHDVTGVWSLSPKLNTAISIGIIPRDELLINRYDTIEKNQVTSFIQSNLSAVFAKFLKNFKEGVTVGISRLVMPLLFVFVGLGLFKKKWKRGQVFPRLFLIAFIFPSFITASFFFANPRYYISALPILLIFIASGINYFDEWLRDIAGSAKGIVKSALLIPWLSQIIIALTCVLLSFNPVFRISFNLLPIFHTEYKETGLWMKDNLSKDSIFIGRSSVNYYAGGFKEIDGKTGNKISTIEDLKAFKRGKNEPVYRFIEERFNWRYGELAFLIAENKAPDFLKPVYVNDRHKGAKVVLYEILDLDGSTKSKINNDEMWQIH